MIDTLTPLLVRFAARAQDKAAPLTAIGEVMVSSTQRTFELQGRPARWKSLSGATLLARAGGKSRAFTKRARKSGNLRSGGLTKKARKTMVNAKILIDRGNLLRSVSSRVSGGSVEWGTNSIYAAIHNFGGMAGRDKETIIPARQFVHEPFADDWQTIEGILTDWLGLEA
ncbi:phage virion morphogenesis protein [Zavarzinia sp.]|uniref:phage virion morphogenesis protein n=1 Tax=Zavarzinia sp. TaxID=2027920 RepID=UPI003564BBFA